MQKEKIILLNACKFNDKKDNTEKCLINYVYCNKEAIVNTDNCYGTFVQTQVIDVNFFTKLKPYFLDSIIMSFDTQYQVKNGRTNLIIKGFSKDGKDISMAKSS